MCSSQFGLVMDNYQGDLTDILRASGGAAAVSQDPLGEWQFSGPDALNFSSSMEEPIQENFGDPFSDMRDPLLNELDIAGSGFFTSTNSTAINSTSVDGVQGAVLEDDQMKTSSPCNSMFSQMMISQNTVLPESPVMAAAAASPRGIKTPVMVTRDMINANSSKGCILENNTGLQISSPRNPGIKRRKSQTKKVVCIPAPPAANGRPGGEVVPSDLWAWRKYGQKPIKGSPYPRGYYRCSSSKGCSARKQVERSRTDPNMLVITYTSEHNHPWPTQRNALAGSTRGQASKSATSSKASPSTNQTQKVTTMKEEENKDSINADNNVSPSIAGSSTTVKEENEDIEKQMDIDDAAEFGEDFSQTYRPTMTDSTRSDDFFAGLGELEGDPLSAWFSQGFPVDEQKETKGIDPFSLFDWSEDNRNNNNNNTPFGGS